MEVLVAVADEKHGGGHVANGLETCHWGLYRVPDVLKAKAYGRITVRSRCDADRQGALLSGVHWPHQPTYEHIAVTVYARFSLADLNVAYLTRGARGIAVMIAAAAACGAAAVALRRPSAGMVV